MNQKQQPDGESIMPFTNILCAREKSTATVTINRPKTLNALNRETLEEIISCFNELAQDSRVLAVIITGSGEKSFVAGADISSMHQFDALAAREFGRLGQEAMTTVETFPRPVIAAVNGFALGGGCELALACDIRIASENAKFGQPEVNLGVHPGIRRHSAAAAAGGQGSGMRAALHRRYYRCPGGVSDRAGKPCRSPAGVTA